MRLLLYIVLLANLVPSSVLAWGAAGHEIVATIAQIHLDPSVFPTICSILNFTSPDPDKPQCHLAPVATWADRVRFKMRWSAPLHYVGAVGDNPRTKCLFPGKQGWEGKEDENVLGAIRNVTDLLADFMKAKREGIADMRDQEVANEALKFLIHFMGDLHQPLHLTGRDRGGNEDKVLFDRRHTNLHSVWDNLLIAKAIRTTPSKYNEPLDDERVEHSLQGTVYDPYVRQIMAEGVLKRWKKEVSQWLSCPSSSGNAAIVDASATATGWQGVLSVWRWLLFDGHDLAAETDDGTLCPYAWGKPIHELNCEIVWPKELDQELSPERSSFVGGSNTSHQDIQLDTPEYAGAIKKKLIIERLLAQAGVRLANTLNLLFAESSVV